MIRDLAYALGDAEILLVWVLLTVFIVVFHALARWWESATGRNVMLLSFSMWLILAVSYAPVALGPDWLLRPYARIVAFGLLAWAIIDRTLIVIVEQRKKRAERHEREHAEGRSGEDPGDAGSTLDPRGGVGAA